MKTKRSVSAPYSPIGRFTIKLDMKKEKWIPKTTLRGRWVLIVCEEASVLIIRILRQRRSQFFVVEGTDEDLGY